MQCYVEQNNTYWNGQRKKKHIEIQFKETDKYSSYNHRNTFDKKKQGATVQCYVEQYIYWNGRLG